MEIVRLVVGELATNCYIVTKDKKTIIIDPGAEASKIIAACQDKNVVGVLITHHHFDHITALCEIENYFGIKEGKDIPTFNYEVLKTPGHTDDSVSFYFPSEKVLFSGDFLFNKGIGRVDLPTGDAQKMQASLKFISQYPDDLKVYPGHGPSTTLKEEKPTFNFYF